jgi:hypothetical protein
VIVRRVPNLVVERQPILIVPHGELPGRQRVACNDDRAPARLGGTLFGDCYIVLQKRDGARQLAKGNATIGTKRLAQLGLAVREGPKFLRDDEPGENSARRD